MSSVREPIERRANPRLATRACGQTQTIEELCPGRDLVVPQLSLREGTKRVGQLLERRVLLFALCRFGPTALPFVVGFFLSLTERDFSLSKTKFFSLMSSPRDMHRVNLIRSERRVWSLRIVSKLYQQPENGLGLRKKKDCNPLGLQPLQSRGDRI